jgi:hypothetical protein
MVRALALAGISLLVAYLLYVAWILSVESWDAFEALLNAKLIVAGDSVGYSTRRSPLASLLWVPLAAVEHIGSLDLFTFRVSHLLAVIVFAAFLWIFYRLLRLHLDGDDDNQRLAWLGTLLMALNPLLIHYAPTAKDDIQGMLLTTAAFHLYVRAGEIGSTRSYLWTGVLVGLAMAIRYSLAPLMLAVIGPYELVTDRWRQKLPLKVVAFLVLPLVLYFLFPIVAYSVTGLSTPWRAPGTWSPTGSSSCASCRCTSPSGRCRTTFSS